MFSWELVTTKQIMVGGPTDLAAQQNPGTNYGEIWTICHIVHISP
jgi:hypothetical protein